MENYIFKSERLGFRNWTDEDKPKMALINCDPAVMEHFPSTQTETQTSEFIDRMKKQFSKKGFCYFAVDKLDTKEFIGFIGLSEQTFISEFTPCVDIGWRLAAQEWGYGFATEGAQRCLTFAFNEMGLKSIKSICTATNIKSEHVMKKIGMRKVKSFNHPLLTEYKDLERCLVYEIKR